eukprot:TRINITY_DN5105_c0_g2_i1.p1 TRINITY_DN5105_c0_g2~~TRINITY_DN5105_c0_g2_i1.p1  ORF type:complete len:182 (+),score=5.88 TRINITY_DN5105_c0_g2_i1:221-766(+)
MCVDTDISNISDTDITDNVLAAADTDTDVSDLTYIFQYFFRESTLVLTPTFAQNFMGCWQIESQERRYWAHLQTERCPFGIHSKQCKTETILKKITKHSFKINKTQQEQYCFGLSLLVFKYLGISRRRQIKSIHQIVDIDGQNYTKINNWPNEGTQGTNFQEANELLQKIPRYLQKGIIFT